MKRILFVDDEPELLNGLRRLLRTQRTSWEMQFVSSGAQALELIDRQPFDVIVADMRMPFMDGAELMNEIMRRAPQTVRIMLSGQSDQDQILRAIGPVHRYLSKPCTPELLMLTIERACSLSSLFGDPPFAEFASSVTKLPCIPRVYQQLVTVLKDPDVSIKTVGNLISQDLALTCQLLHLVNSCFFGWPTRIESPSHAASLLGMDRLRALALSAGVFTQFTGKLPEYISLDDLMQRSLATSLVAQRLMKIERPNEPELANEAMLGGMVVDVGHLILLQNRSEDYRILLESTFHEGGQICEEENRKFKITHAQLGAYLLGLWGLPESIVEAVAFHHSPAVCAENRFNVLTAVHVADALFHELDSSSHWPFGAVLEETYLKALGLEDRVDLWRKEINSFILETA